MRKTLYLHIGHFKTGTTAIQEFLSHNPEFLKRQKLCYARSARQYAKHSDLAYSLYLAAGVETLLHGYNKPQTPQQLWQNLFEELRSSRASRMIVSTEELIRLAGFPKALDAFKEIVATAPDIDFKVIAYLRAPESHLRSWYNQLVKMKIATPSYNSAVTGFMEKVHYDYGFALGPWIEMFGAKSVILRSYCDEVRQGNALFHDFLSIFDVNLPARGVDFLGREANPRLADKSIEVMRVMQNAKAPIPVIKPTVERYNDFLDKELVEGIGPKPDELAPIRQQVLDGLDQLGQKMPEFAETLSGFRERLPQGDEQTVRDGWLLAGFLLSEIHSLRKVLNLKNAEFASRIEALERACTSKETTQS
ncbi:hypothetical protein [Pseudophaeobacter sp.]|uniref:hypothetical protein n=1 Tax=Pseudophaeobacter sp. TaxID=1971739 RepID=UPI003298098D